MEPLPDIVAVMVSVSVEGPYSYRVPAGMTVSRGSIVAVPLVGRLTLGVVWGAPKDNFAHNRLKDIAHVYDTPPLSEELLKTVDWVSRYTLAAPGLVLRSVLRSTEALEPERPVTAYRRTGHEPERMTPARLRVLDVVADGSAWAKAAIVGASGVSASVVEGLEKAGALERVEMPPPPIVLPPDPEAAVPMLSAEQAAALAQIRELDVGEVRGGAARRGHRRRQDRGVLRGGGRYAAGRAAGADPAARDRAHPHLPRPLHPPLRHAARRVALRHDAGAARPHLARRARRHGAGGGRARARRCSCRSASWGCSCSTRSTTGPTSSPTGSTTTPATWRWCGPSSPRRG